VAVFNDPGLGEYCMAFVYIPSRSWTDVPSQDLQIDGMHVLINNMLGPVHNHLTPETEHGSVQQPALLLSHGT